MKLETLASVTLIALGALTLQACGGDDAGSSPTAPSSPTAQTVRVSGSVATSTTWTASNVYLLQGAVFVRAGATLTIEPGTKVVGEKSSLGTLVVERGARLVANGTADRPIVMTSEAAVGSRRRGDWGGLILNGAAPLNVAGSEKFGEGDTGRFGGSDPADSSGSLQYLRVEFAGIEFSPDNELNGIAFQGVGGGTVCDHLQVHFNQDDGFEWFGGTVSCKYLLATAAGDDSFDWTDGWTGRGQFWIAQQKADDADNGFESDNLSSDVNAEPRSNPTLYNVTLIGDPSTATGAGSANGMVLRVGTAGTLRNFIVMGFKRSGADVRDASVSQANSGALSVSNSIFHANGSGATTYGAWATTGAIVDVNPQLGDPYNLAAPNFQPAVASAARSGALAVAQPPGDGFFETVNFIGAVGATNWAAGWTTAVQN
jgi:hypothetical protein